MTNADLIEAAAAELLALPPEDRPHALEKLAAEYAAARCEQEPAADGDRLAREARTLTVLVANALINRDEAVLQ